jgi:hypothetical protein
MPLQFEEATTADGLPYLILDVAGHFDLEDAHALYALVRPGQPHHGGYLFVRVAKGTEYTPKARNFLSSLRGNYKVAAVVVTSAIGRAAINIILRLSGGPAGLIRLFTDEGEALAWLQSVAR